jgi:hypothetical protein
MTSQYGPEFDRLTARWRVLEGEHDRMHPDRDECGGVGGCTLMRAATDLEIQMITELESWRREGT